MDDSFKKFSLNFSSVSIAIFLIYFSYIGNHTCFSYAWSEGYFIHRQRWVHSRWVSPFNATSDLTAVQSRHISTAGRALVFLIEFSFLSSLKHIFPSVLFLATGQALSKFQLKIFVNFKFSLRWQATWFSWFYCWTCLLSSQNISNASDEMHEADLCWKTSCLVVGTKPLTFE